MIAIRIRTCVIACAAAVLLGACANSPSFHYEVPAVGMQAPEAASGYTEKFGTTATKFMVAAANPLPPMPVIRC